MPQYINDTRSNIKAIKLNKGSVLFLFLTAMKTYYFNIKHINVLFIPFVYLSRSSDDLRNN